MIFVGVDPGFSGAIAILSGSDVVITDTPTYKVKSGKKNKNMYNESMIVQIFSSLPSNDTHIAIEKVHSMPGQGVASMFSMGEGYGLLRGIISALKLPYTLITPQSWKKEMMYGQGKEKAASCHRAQQLFPNAELFGPQGGAKDGRGDALLIAEYCRRNFKLE